MLMCRCECCRSLFDPMEVATYKEDYGEVFQACPICGGDFRSDVMVCDDCGVVMTFDDDGLVWVCPECGKEGN